LIGGGAFDQGDAPVAEDNEGKPVRSSRKRLNNDADADRLQDPENGKKSKFLPHCNRRKCLLGFVPTRS